MLDVHVPHKSDHTWTDFFIHISTIVIGLLIAIGLEQTVEYFHHRELASHAREMLAQENEINRRFLERNIYAIKLHQNYLFNDLLVLGRARAHKLNPDDKIVYWHPYYSFLEFSWQTIHESGAAAWLSFDELHRYSRAYSEQQFFNAKEEEAGTRLQRAQTVFYRGPQDRFRYDLAPSSSNAFGDSGEAAARASLENQAPGADRIAGLTPAQMDELERAIQEGIYEDDRLISICGNIQTSYSSLPSAKNSEPAK
jgi:hypothetical protein